MANLKKRSIRDTLKDLEIQSGSASLAFKDPEDEDDIFKSAKLVNDVDPNFDDELLELKVGSLRNKAYSSLEEHDPKYFGKKTSRKVIENDEVSSHSEEENRSSELDESSEENSSDLSNSDQEDASNQSSNDDDNNDDFNIEVVQSEVPHELQVNNDDTTYDGVNGIENFRTTNVEDDRRKGMATKLQIDLLDKLLESRIRLQKSLQIVNRLPQCANMKSFASQSNLHAKDNYFAAKGSLVELLGQLLKFQSLLFEKNSETSTLLTSDVNESKKVDLDEEITSESECEENEANKANKVKPASNLPTKRKHAQNVEDFEEEISKRHKVALPYHEALINKWYEKTRLSSGKINTKNFSAFDKSTLQQINQVLSDKERLIKRTQLRRTSYKILGEIEKTDDLSTLVPDSHLKDYNEQIFDDSDFYHEMLKELIERKTNIESNDPTAIGRQWLEFQKLRKKVKRKIDTRASKGRKVRYDIHPKLVNFMAPQQDGKMSDQARNDLFSSLFGQNRSLVIQ